VHRIARYCRNRNDCNETSTSMFDNYLPIISIISVAFFIGLWEQHNEKLTSHVRAESTAVSLFLVAFKHLLWEGRIWISDTKLFNPFPDTKNSPNLPSGYLHTFIARVGRPHLKIFYRTRSILAPVGHPGPFTHVDLICIVVTYMQICV